MKTKIPEYPPISNPSEQQGFASNSRMSCQPYHEQQSLNMFLISSYGDRRPSRSQDQRGPPVCLPQLEAKTDLLLSGQSMTSWRQVYFFTIRPWMQLRSYTLLS